MRSKTYHVIFIYGGRELIEGIFILLPEVIVFLNQHKFNQLHTDSDTPPRPPPPNQARKSFITFFIKWIAP